MRLTLISHACWLIETADLTILTDPVFCEVFYDSLATWCPSRRFDPDALPEIDAIFLSHVHHDHFDPPTLAGLARRVPMIFCSSDPDVVDACRRVGFETVHPIKNFQQFKIGKTTLHITPAINSLDSEHGLLVTDPDARVWNAVDSAFKPEWLPVLRIDDRGLDVHIASFTPVLLHDALANGTTHYPYEPYARHLETARLGRAKLIVPGASGVSWLHRGSWMNHYLFPIKHKRFIEDVRGFENGSRAELCFPGDVIEILNGEPSVHHQARPELVTTLDPKTFDRLDFNPTYPVPPLATVDAQTQITVGIEGITSLRPRLVTVPAAGFASLQELEHTVESILALTNRRLAEPGLESFKDTLFRWEARMKLTIHFPEGPRYWSCDFSLPSPAFTEGEITAPNYFLELTAIDVHAVEHGLIFDQFIHTGLRCFHTLYRVRKEGMAYPALPTQLRREVEAELHYGEVLTPFEAFMQLWRPTRVPWTERLVKLSIECVERETASSAAAAG